MEEQSEKPKSPPEFVRRAEESPPGFFAELFEFLRTSKKWWLTPIIILLLAIGLLLVLGSSAVAPFIYTLF